MSSRLAVIGTFYRRHENTPRIAEAIRAQTRHPDELWLMAEDDDDLAIIAAQDWGPSDVYAITVPTPRTEDGRYAVIPYSHKINRALDATSADYIVYLDNGSLPAPAKYEKLAALLDEHPGVGATYCGQHRTGVVDFRYEAIAIVPDAYCVLNYTQVMHRRTDDRWTLDMKWSNPDLADALFWRSLHASLGPFYPVGGTDILDWHHIEDYKAQGL